MKKFLLALLVVFGAVNLANAQCTPGEEFGNGIYPDTTTNFVQGCKGVPYEQIVSILVPSDTVVADLGDAPADFEFIRVDDVTGLPDGLTFECSPNDCTFLPLDPGCAIIHGTTNEVGTHNLIFELTAKVVIGGIVPVEDEQTLESYRIIIEDCESVNINELIKEEVSFEVFPNPATEIINITNLDTYGVKNIHIFNAEGKAVHTVFTENESVSINLSNLNAGIYFIKVMQNGKHETVQVIVE